MVQVPVALLGITISAFPASHVDLVNRLSWLPLPHAAHTMQQPGFLAAARLLAAASIVPGTTGTATWRDYTAVARTPATCPDYTDYAQVPHAPFTSGSLGLPDMRPTPACRTFNSSAAERVIADMQARLVDPDVARLFANAFASTLDTTVKYFDAQLNLAFIITGVSVQEPCAGALCRSPV